MAKKDVYTLRTNKGNQITRTQEVVMEYAKQYLQKHSGIENHSPSECENEIEHFVSKMILIEKNGINPQTGNIIKFEITHNETNEQEKNTD